MKKVRSLNSQPANKEVFIWNFLGSLSNSFLSVITLMVVTRILDSSETDIFSIAWSISQLMATIGTFQVHTYQATDVKERFKFGQYFQFRVFTVFVMMISSVGYVLVQGYTSYKSFAVLIICLFRAVEAFADVYEGYFQQKERLDLCGKANTYRIWITLIVFSLVGSLTHNLILCCLALLISFTSCFIAFNLRYAHSVDIFDLKEAWDKKTKWWLDLSKECMPIFVNSFLMMMITNAPKMKIDSGIASGTLANGTQTVYSILFMPASVLTLVYIVFRPLLTKMAVEWTDGRIKEFLKIVGLIFGCLLIVSILGILVCSFIGTPVLSILYGIDLSPYTLELIVIVIGGCLCTFSYVFDNALIVMRKQYLLLISYVISWVITELFVGILVTNYGLLGAALSYVVSMGCFLVVTFIIFLVNIHKKKSKC